MNKIFDNKVDKEKITLLSKLVYGMTVARPAVLLLVDDNFCWLQFYVLRWLEIDSIIFIPEEHKTAISFKLPTITANMWIYYYKDKSELKGLMTKAIKRYEQKVIEELEEKNE